MIVFLHIEGGGFYENQPQEYYPNQNYHNPNIQVINNASIQISPDRVYNNSALETTDDMMAGKKFRELRKCYNKKLPPLN